MAISDPQKVDLLFKKIGYGVGKTDISTNKSPANEGNASPLVSPGSTIYQQDYAIPSVTTLPTSNSSVVTVYRDSLTSTIQCAKLPTTSANVSWTTGLTDWIPVQYGTGYQVKLYAGPPGSSTPQNYTSLPADGSGSNDSWYFDYQDGIVNFADTSVPAAANAGGNVVYVVGARYTGIKGITTFANLTVSGNIVTSNLTVNGAGINGNINGIHTGNILADTIGPNVTNVVVFTNTTALGLPAGSNVQYPSSNVAGYFRYNTTTNVPEFFNGSGWVPVVNSITDQQITPDGSNTNYTLNMAATANGIIVSINGTLQRPGVAYTVSGNTITFAEAPGINDIIDIRFIASAVSSVLDYEVVDTGNVTVGTANTIVDSFSATQYRSVKYIISSSNGTDATMAEVSVVQNNGTVLLSAFGILNTGANTLTFYANTSGSTVNLLAQGSTTANQLRIQRTYFNV
jgi:hypothetical protein